LDSHQIEGGANTSDYVNIFPVIQWLVKKVIETREETGDLIRKFSEFLYQKGFESGEESTEFTKVLFRKLMTNVYFRYPLPPLCMLENTVDKEGEFLT
jgi:hypothetical protein